MFSCIFCIFILYLVYIRFHSYIITCLHVSVYVCGCDVCFYVCGVLYGRVFMGVDVCGCVSGSCGRTVQ